MSDPRSHDPRPMPVLFVGHGSPMNAVEVNQFTLSLRNAAEKLPAAPNAILVVSAHWTSEGSFVSSTTNPRTIYDFSGFPEELSRVIYLAPGAPEFARRVAALLPGAIEDRTRGLDHGAWTILRHLYPDANVPVFEVSLDVTKSPEDHFALAKLLRPLRDEGVLVIGSGGIVHNPAYYRPNPAPFDWAVQFDEWVKRRIDERDFESLIHYERAGEAALLSVPTNEHYLPMLYALALADERESIAFFYDEVVASLGMGSFRIE